MRSGLSHRTHILALLEEQIDHVKQGTHSCGVVLMDLDHFKQVNDRYGHEAGDTVLRHLARPRPQVLQREDCYGCIGGEEFVLLPDATAASLNSTVQRLSSSTPARQV